MVSLLLLMLTLLVSTNGFLFSKISIRHVPFSLAAFPTEPEPDSGTLLEQLSSVSDLRLNKLTRCKTLQTNVLGSRNPEQNPEVNNYWVTSVAPSSAIKETTKQLQIQAAKKAQFPGFRKGQLPPHAKKKIVGFAVRESIQDQMKFVIQQGYGLETVKKNESDEGDITFLENIDELTQAYKEGEDVPFTACFSGKVKIQGGGAANCGDYGEEG